MTEAEWLTCDYPKRMLDFLRGKASDRKLRLFACACSQALKHWMTDSRSIMAVEVGEQFADGQATEGELFQAHRAAYDAAVVAGRYMPGETGENWVRGREAARCAEQAARSGSPTAGEAAWYGAYDATRFLKSALKKWPTSLLFEIFANPFRPVILTPVWIAWNDAIVVRIAQAIYDERAFDRLPILADALEDVGCDNADILRHCREPGEHVRGCWVVDLLLGKE